MGTLGSGFWGVKNQIGVDLPSNIAAVDVGQSGSRLRLPDGLTLQGGPAYSPAQGLPYAVRETLRLEKAWKCEVLALSLTALRGVVSDIEELGLICQADAGAQEVVVMDDGLAAHAGAFGNQDGVVLCVGTGVSVVARYQDRAAHRDGDGPVVGDDGGGYWLGREAMRAALRAKEDRGPATTLLHSIENKFGDLRKAVRSESDETIVRWCVDVVPILMDAADSGDLVAQQIVETGASLLAASAIAAWRELNSEEVPSLSGVGGVMQSPYYRDAILRNFLTAFPQAKWHPASGNNLDGAIALAKSNSSDMAPLLKWWRS